MNFKLGQPLICTKNEWPSLRWYIGDTPPDGISLLCFDKDLSRFIKVQGDTDMYISASHRPTMPLSVFLMAYMSDAVFSTARRFS